MADEEPPLLFRARVDVGEYTYIKSNGEKITTNPFTWYGDVREVVGTARGDATRKSNELKKYSLAGKNGAVIEKHLEACIADWRIVE